MQTSPRIATLAWIAALSAALACFVCCRPPADSPARPARDTPPTGSATERASQTYPAPLAAAAPRRIVTIAPNSAEILCAIGAGDAIVGVDKFCVYPPELADRPRVGGLFDPNLELITTLRPDLVVLRGRSEDVEQLCSRLGVRVYHDPTERLADIPRCIRELGAITGRPEAAAEVERGFNERIAAIKRHVAAVLGDRPRPRVLITLARDPTELEDVFTAGPGTYVDELIDIAGGENLYGRTDMAYPTVSMESVLTGRPDVIIELMPEVRLTEALKRQMLEQWQRVGPTPALADGRIFFIGDELNNALIPSPRYPDVIEAIARLLHPSWAPVDVNAKAAAQAGPSEPRP